MANQLPSRASSTSMSASSSPPQPSASPAAPSPASPSSPPTSVLPPGPKPAHSSSFVLPAGFNFALERLPHFEAATSVAPANNLRKFSTAIWEAYVPWTQKAKKNKLAPNGSKSDPALQDQLLARSQELNPAEQFWKETTLHFKIHKSANLFAIFIDPPADGPKPRAAKDILKNLRHLVLADERFSDSFSWRRAFNPRASLLDSFAKLQSLETIEVSWPLFSTYTRDFAFFEQLDGLNVYRIVKLQGVRVKITYKLSVNKCYGTNMTQAQRADELETMKGYILDDIKRKKGQNGLSRRMDDLFWWVDALVEKADFQLPVETTKGWVLGAADRLDPVRGDTCEKVELRLLYFEKDESWVVKRDSGFDNGFEETGVEAEIRVFGFRGFEWVFKCECEEHLALGGKEVVGKELFEALRIQ